MKPDSINLIVTSPPYKIEGGFSEDLIENFIIESKRVLKNGRHLCLNFGMDLIGDKNIGFRTIHNPMHTAEKFAYMNNLHLYSAFVWKKRTHQKSFGSYPYPPNFLSNPNFELIYIFKKEGIDTKPSNNIKEISKLSQKEWLDFAIDSVWDIPPIEPTSKLRDILPENVYPFPREIPYRLIKMYSFVNEIILDPFLGSGTTMKVAQDLRRNCIGIEINPKCIEIVKKQCFGQKFLTREVKYKFIDWNI